MSLTKEKGIFNKSYRKKILETFYLQKINYLYRVPLGTSLCKKTWICDSTVIPMTISSKEHIFFKVLYDEKNCAEHY